MNKEDQRQPSKDKLGAIHHYVPQGYLKRFATKNNPDQIVAYEIGKKPYITNIHNIAGQRDFYTYTVVETGQKDSALEDALADVDAEGVNMMRLLDDMTDGFIDLPEKQKGNLLAYIAFQHTRNLQERKMWATSYGQSTKMHMQAVASHKKSYHKDAKKAFGEKYDYEKVENSRKAFLDGKAEIKFDPMDQYFMGAALDMSRTLYEILFTLKKAVLVSKTHDAGVFVTSDNPVTHYLTAQQRAKRPAFFQGVGYIDAIFQIPISPYRCLLLVNEDMVMETFQYNQDAVNYINYFTYHFADRWIFSNLEDRTITDHFKKFKRTAPITSISSPFNRSSKL
ncbi:MAG: DUF4238 domain-containing protein [Candidatus Saccharibacteria bacterium]|nr:DUF4238 domain-containing protein [Candidatus Saccharibacteria bacterium]